MSATATLNAPALSAVMTQVIDHPEAHDQSVYYRDVRGCGTAACLAGWTGLMYGAQYGWEQVKVENLFQEFWGRAKGEMVKIVLAEEVIEEKMYSSWFVHRGRDVMMHISDVAREILGLDYYQAMTLFSGSNTRPMLGLMVKDLIDGIELEGIHKYRDQIYGVGNRRAYFDDNCREAAALPYERHYEPLP